MSDLKRVMGRLSHEDQDMVEDYLQGLREPNLVIAPDGRPYIYRWYLTPEELRHKGGMYLHVQVMSDPERPLHDHPRDTTSVILANGYNELWNPQPWMTPEGVAAEELAIMRKLKAGDVVFRNGGEGHRLLFEDQQPYSISLFTIGPKYKPWGFWTNNGWVDDSVLITTDEKGHSIFREVEYAKAE